MALIRSMRKNSLAVTRVLQVSAFTGHATLESMKQVKDRSPLKGMGGGGGGGGVWNIFLRMRA